MLNGTKIIVPKTEILKKEVKLDMVKAVEEAAEGKSTRYMVDTHGAGYIINKRKIDETAEAIKQEQVLEEQREEMRQTKLK